MVRHPTHLLVRALLEQERGLQLGNQRLVHHFAPTSARYRWTNETAIAPSPTPEATRFTEPCRTSPTTKIPGTLVSNNPGSRSTCHPLGRFPSRIRSGPESMNPSSSRSTTFASHAVFGAAPIMMKSALAGTFMISLVAEQWTETASRCSSP